MERLDVSELKYDDNGLIPAIVQDCQTGEILMMAYMNNEAVQRTIDSGKATFWSRSRQKFWIKGETSGNFLVVDEIFFDCDKDTLLVKVTPAGAACHEGYRSCFFRKINKDMTVDTVGERMFDPKEVYKNT